jgi:hypothetical protein
LENDKLYRAFELAYKKIAWFCLKKQNNHN